MNIEVRYCSRNGRNKKLAEVIAKELGADIQAKSVDQPLDKVDVLFVGGGVYFLMLDKKLKQFLNGLDDSKVGLIVPFGMAAKTNAAKRVEKIAKANGLQVCKTILFLKKSTEHKKIEEEVKKFVDKAMEQAKEVKINPKSSSNSGQNNSSLMSSIEKNAQIENGQQLNSTEDIHSSDSTDKQHKAGLIQSIEKNAEIESGQTEGCSCDCQECQCHNHSHHQHKSVDTLVDSIEKSAELEGGMQLMGDTQNTSGTNNQQDNSLSQSVQQNAEIESGANIAKTQKNKSSNSKSKSSQSGSKSKSSKNSSKSKKKK